MTPGLRIVCIREVQKSLEQSAKRLIEDKIKDFGLQDKFHTPKTHIDTPGEGIIVFQGMQDHNADSVKSLEGFDIAWVEEAQTLSAHSWKLLRPTIRKDDSEIWCSWNPRRKQDPVDDFFRNNTPDNAIVVEANWRDNPWFTNKLEQDRQTDLIQRPEQYDHIWEGGYETVYEGAYYAKALTEAKNKKRIGKVGPDPLMTYKLFVDIGGTGAKADTFVIWVAQFIGKEIRALDYYEAQGQPLDTHLAWLRGKGYTPDRAEFILPHDGKTNDRVYDVSYESALGDAGYEVEVIPNQGKGAAKQRIEAGRRVFPSIWFNEETTRPGLDALGAYHERKDEARQIGLGPEHDWASHAADAFGLMCIVHKESGPTTWEELKYPELGIV